MVWRLRTRRTVRRGRERRGRGALGPVRGQVV